MNDRTATWKAEHENFRRLLDLVDSQVAVFHRGDQPDYGLMLDVMHYMTHYPDRYHHPLEDGACRLLLKRDPDFSDPVDELARQHAQIAESGTRLVKDLNAIVDGAFMQRAAVEDDAQRYTRTMRRHMQSEEEAIFPALQRLLRDGDWRQIEADIAAAKDPVFGASVDPRYAALHARIAEQVGCTCTPVG